MQIDLSKSSIAMRAMHISFMPKQLLLSNMLLETQYASLSWIYLA